MDAQRREELASASVAVLMALRAQYLAEGANPLRHWDQLQDRMRVATRTSDSPEQWVTTLARELRLSRAPSSELSTLVVKLADVVRANVAEWLEWLESEYGWVMAKMRLESERRQEISAHARKGSQEKTPVDEAIDYMKGEHA